MTGRSRSKDDVSESDIADNIVAGGEEEEEEEEAMGFFIIFRFVALGRDIKGSKQMSNFYGGTQRIMWAILRFRFYCVVTLSLVVVVE